MKHFVIVHDWASDYENGASILGVAHSMEEAKEIFQKHLADEKQFTEEEGLAIYEDCETAFDAGKDGFYLQAHTHLYIEEV